MFAFYFSQKEVPITHNSAIYFHDHIFSSTCLM